MGLEIFNVLNQNKKHYLLTLNGLYCRLSKPLRWATQKTNSPSHEELEIRVYSFGSTGQNPSVNNASNERLPAQKIGFKRLIQRLVHSFINNISNILHRK